MQFKQSNLDKRNENRRYDDFTVKTFDSRFTSAVWFASRLALAHLLCTSTDGASGCSSALSGGSKNSDFCRTRVVSASDRRSLLASPHLAKSECRSQAVARCGDVSGADLKRRSKIICATHRRWRITGNGRLLPDQLQAEMERMASHTKQPGVLREIFAALGNDPFVIAECLARPVLAERLITELYAHDQRFHGELKRRAEAELRRTSVHRTDETA